MYHTFTSKTNNALIYTLVLILILPGIKLILGYLFQGVIFEFILEFIDFCFSEAFLGCMHEGYKKFTNGNFLSKN